MRVQFEYEGDYLKSTSQKNPIWLYGMFGHTGYIKQAARMAGVEVYGQNRPANQLGATNPAVHLIFPQGPDEALVAQLKANYRKLTQDAADRRKNGVKKPVVVKPIVQRTPKAPKPMKSFCVFANSEGVYNEDAPRPEKFFEATSAYAAKELYEKWYQQEYHRMAPFELKSREIK